MLEVGKLSYPESGTPQGGVVSPILANIYLHEVLDVWFETEVRPRMRARAHLVRYADDAVMLFEFEEDARRVLEVLPERFEKYGLSLHPEKTRLVPFKRPDRIRKRPSGDDAGPQGPATFDFHVRWLWKRWLSRRSDKARLDWHEMERSGTRFPGRLPRANVSYQTRNPRSRMREIRTSGSVGDRRG